MSTGQNFSAAEAEYTYALPVQRKKADVAEHPEVFDYVGLLINEPPGTAELLFT